MARTLTELRQLRRGLLALFADRDKDLAEYLALFEESLTRLEDMPVSHASARFRAVREELRSTFDADTKPIPKEEAEALRRKTDPWGRKPHG